MKYLIMCEGPNEKEIIDILVESGKFFVREDELLGLTAYHARQIKKSAQVRTELNIYPGKVKVLRIGDKQSDKLVIPAEYKDKIDTVEKYCTKPELEILLIIAENLTDEFNKVKSTMSPKDFAKKYIRCGRRKYDNSTSFYRDYFGNNPDLLVECIRKYKKYNGAHSKAERYLEELVRTSS